MYSLLQYFKTYYFKIKCEIKLMKVMPSMLIIVLASRVTVRHLYISTLKDHQGLSRYLETGCPNRGFIDFCVSKVWYKIHTTNKIDPIPLQILLF